MIFFHLITLNSYDEFLKMSQQGDNLVLDLIVKDICGELVSEKVCMFLNFFPLCISLTVFTSSKLCQQGLSSSTLASSFGKVISSKTTLSDYKPEDLATTLLSAFTYNIAQVCMFSSFCCNLELIKSYFFLRERLHILFDHDK